MKKLGLIIAAGLLSFSAHAEPEDSTMVYFAVAPTVEAAQAVMDGINSNMIKACRFGGSYDTEQTVYSVSIKSGTAHRVNKFGQLVPTPKKSQFKVKCEYRDND